MTYGCHNKPRPTPETTHVAQSGWSDVRDGYGHPCRAPIYVDITHVFSLDCRYDKSSTDPQCAGCAHANQGKK